MKKLNCALTAFLVLGPLSNVVADTITTDAEILFIASKDLFSAIKRGDKTSVDVALRGKDVNKIVNENGESPLHMATYNNQPDMIVYLVEKHNANPHIKNGNGETPLYIAKHYKYKASYKALKKVGATH